MRIGIDLSVLRQKPWTGIPNYVAQLQAALKKLETKHEFVFFDGPKSRIPFWSNHVSYARYLKKQNLDVLHGPANTLPLLYRGKNVITIHDLAIYKHPEWFPGGQWLATKIVVPRSINKARKIIVPSKSTAMDLKEIFHVADDKIAIIPHGVEERFFRRDPNTQIHPNDPNDSGHSDGDPGHSSRYILFVGTLEPRKNLWRVIEAYQGLPDGLKNRYELWIAGGKGWRDNGIKNTESRIKPGIKFLDYVKNEDLPQLYQSASLFVYPSLYEGFGLPVLEAAAAGCPVITSKNSAMAEFYPMSLVDPNSTTEIKNELERILKDETLRREISKKGIEIAKQFTWERTAKQTLQVYEKIK